MFSWELVGIIAGFWGKKKKVVSDFKFSLVCFLFGFVFDWIMNLWFISGFVRPVNLESIIGTYIAGLTFDVLHGGSSFIFSFIFYDNFIVVFQRYKRKLNITYIRDENKYSKNVKV
jgi:energy-coupling factor transport system substrate-specific component